VQKKLGKKHTHTKQKQQKKKPAVDSVMSLAPHFQCSQRDKIDKDGNIFMISHPSTNL